MSSKEEYREKSREFQTAVLKQLLDIQQEQMDTKVQILSQAEKIQKAADHWHYPAAAVAPPEQGVVVMGVPMGIRYENDDAGILTEKTRNIFYIIIGLGIVHFLMIAQRFWWANIRGEGLILSAINIIWVVSCCACGFFGAKNKNKELLTAFWVCDAFWFTLTMAAIVFVSWAVARYYEVSFLVPYLFLMTFCSGVLIMEAAATKFAHDLTTSQRFGQDEYSHGHMHGNQYTLAPQVSQVEAGFPAHPDPRVQ